MKRPHYIFDAGVVVTAFLAEVDFVECFFDAVFLTLLLPVALVAEAVLAAFGAGAEVVCAAKDTPASANVIVMPRIVEIVFVIVLSCL